MSHSTMRQEEDPHPALSHADVGEVSRGAAHGAASCRRTLYDDLCRQVGHELAGPPLVKDDLKLCVNDSSFRQAVFILLHVPSQMAFRISHSRAITHPGTFHPEP